MEKHHRLRRDPSWDPNGCNICGKVGHQAATCPNGTVDWRERLGSDKLYTWWFKPKKLRAPESGGQGARAGSAAEDGSDQAAGKPGSSIAEIRKSWKKERKYRKLAKRAVDYAKVPRVRVLTECTLIRLLAIHSIIIMHTRTQCIPECDGSASRWTHRQIHPFFSDFAFNVGPLKRMQ